MLNGKKLIDVCSKCGLPKSEHCEFEAIEIPESCVCDIREWGDIYDIPDVCDCFCSSDEYQDICTRCEHLKDCHKK